MSYRGNTLIFLLFFSDHSTPQRVFTTQEAATIKNADAEYIGSAAILNGSRGIA
ncbi:MAG: Uncharacterised protein [Bacteroidetes bacterium MED-G17]|nr:MAG: Uncharacterised protein [Bacteroidetes bacterium MED-G17]